MMPVSIDYTMSAAVMSVIVIMPVVSSGPVIVAIYRVIIFYGVIIHGPVGTCITESNR